MVTAVIYDPETGKILSTRTSTQRIDHPFHIVVDDGLNNHDSTHKVVNGKLVPLEKNQAEEDHMASAKVRTVRDRLISDTDWTETPGGQRRLSPEKRRAYEDYRAALFDISKQSGFPHNITWPKEP